MSDLIVALKDTDGRVHYTSRSSEFARNGLERGELSEVDPNTGEPIEQPEAQKQEVDADATADAQAGDDRNARRARGRSRDGERASRDSDQRDDASVAESEVNR